MESMNASCSSNLFISYLDTFRTYLDSNFYRLNDDLFKCEHWIIVANVGRCLNDLSIVQDENRHFTNLGQVGNNFTSFHPGIVIFINQQRLNNNKDLKRRANLRKIKSWKHVNASLEKGIKQTKIRHPVWSDLKLRICMIFKKHNVGKIGLDSIQSLLLLWNIRIQKKFTLWTKGRTRSSSLYKMRSMTFTSKWRSW